MTDTLTHPLITAALSAARTAGATPLGCKVTGRRVAVEVSCADDLEAIGWARHELVDYSGTPPQCQAVVDGQRVVFWAGGAA